MDSGSVTEKRSAGWRLMESEDRDQEEIDINTAFEVAW